MQAFSILAVCQWVSSAEGQCKIPGDLNLQYHSMKSHIHYITLCQQILLQYVLLGILGRSLYLKHLLLVKELSVLYVCKAKTFIFIAPSSFTTAMHKSQVSGHPDDWLLYCAA